MFDVFNSASPLRRHAHFNRLWAAQSLSGFGNRITRTAVPIIAVMTLDAGPIQTAALTAVSLAPVVLAGLFGAGFIERANKVRLMVAMDLVRFAAVIAAPLAWSFHVLSFGVLCVIAGVTGLAGALFANADVSVLPRLVGKTQLVEANGRLQATESLAELLGPGAAGVLIDLLTAPVAVVADALTFLWSAFWLFRIPKAVGDPVEETLADAPAPPAGLKRLRDDFVIGLAAVARRPPVRAVILSLGIFYLTNGAFGALYTLFMLRELHLTASAMGLIISLGGVSALAGSQAALPLARRLGFGPALILGFLVAMIGVAMLIPASIFAGRPWAPLFVVAQQLFGDAGFMVFTILSTSLSQKLLPEDEIARANGVSQVVAGTTMTASILGAGAIAEVLGVRSTVAWASGLGVLGLLPLLTPALWSLRDDPKRGEPAGADPQVAAGG